MLSALSERDGIESSVVPRRSLIRAYARAFSSAYYVGKRAMVMVMVMVMVMEMEVEMEKVMEMAMMDGS